MRRVRYCVAMSLDGYIAGPKGEFDWIVQDPEKDFRALMGAFDTILVGRRTWEMMRGMGRTGMPGMKAYVFSRTLREEDCPGATLSDDPVGTIASIRKQPGKDLWLFGGGLLFAGLLEAGLVDTVEVGVIPVLLGAGIPLLPPGGTSAKLTLSKHRVYGKSGTVELVYEVVERARS